MVLITGTLGRMPRGASAASSQLSLLKSHAQQDSAGAQYHWTRTQATARRCRSPWRTSFLIRRSSEALLVGKMCGVLRCRGSVARVHGTHQITQRCSDNCPALRSRDAPSLPRVLIQTIQLPLPTTCRKLESKVGFYHLSVPTNFPQIKPWILRQTARM